MSTMTKKRHLKCSASSNSRLATCVAMLNQVALLSSKKNAVIKLLENHNFDYPKTLAEIRNMDLLSFGNFIQL